MTLLFCSASRIPHCRPEISWCIASRLHRPDPSSTSLSPPTRDMCPASNVSTTCGTSCLRSPPSAFWRRQRPRTLLAATLNSTSHEHHSPPFAVVSLRYGDCRRWNYSCNGASMSTQHPSPCTAYRSRQFSPSSCIQLVMPLMQTLSLAQVAPRMQLQIEHSGLSTFFR